MGDCARDSKDYVEGGEPREGPCRCPPPVGGSSAGPPRSLKLSSTSSSSSSSSESSLAFSDAFGLPPAPDGGWGWLVVLGAFVISLICDGCAFSFGVMFVYLIEEFQQTKSQTAWVASIFYSLSLLLGPVAGALTTRYGCRVTTMAAGVLSCVGFVASSYVTAVWQLYITFGMVVGASFSVCYITSVLTVAYYFDKRRSLATGLSVCGTGIGTFTFAPLCEFLVGMYGWRGTFMILGAISLNICVCGALFRPLTFTPEQRRQCHLTAFNKLARPVSRLSIPSRNRSRLHSTNSETSSSSSSESEDDVAALAYSQITLPTYVKADSDTIRRYLDKLPELRRSSADPQLALQRFFKSKDIELASRSSVHQGGDCKNEAGAKRDKGGKQRSSSITKAVAESELEDSQLEMPAKRKRRKHAKKARESSSPNNTLSEKEMTEKLLENGGSRDGVHTKKHNSRHSQEQVGSSLESQELLSRGLERSQSEKIPGKLQCNVEGDGALGRSLSEKIPAKLRCQTNSGPASAHLAMPTSKRSGEAHCRIACSANIMHSSTVDPPPSTGNEMGMMLMNKHSTYLILHRNDIFFRGSRMHKPVPCATSCPELSRLPSSDSESDDENCLVDQCPCLERIVGSLEDTCDKKIVTHPLFLLFALSNFFLYFWADVPYVFATDFALSLGTSESRATFLISVIGIVNTIGQVIYGLVGDQDWNLTVIYGISCIGSGLAVLLLPTAKVYWLMSVLCGLFGFFLSANFSLMTVMLVGYLGLEKLVYAYGLIMMIQGLANLGGPPVAGWLVDSTGNYDLAFPIAGGFIMLSGIIVFFLYIMRLCGRFCLYCCPCQKRPRRRWSITIPEPVSSDQHDSAAWIQGPPKPDHSIV